MYASVATSQAINTRDILILKKMTSKKKELKSMTNASGLYQKEIAQPFCKTNTFQFNQLNFKINYKRKKGTNQK